MLQDVLKKALKTRQRRQVATMLLAEYRVSERRACATVFLYRSVYRYLDQPRDDRAVRQRMKEGRRDTGALWLRAHLYPAAARRLVRQHKRTYRIYKEEGLNLRSKRNLSCYRGFITWLSKLVRPIPILVSA